MTEFSRHAVVTVTGKSWNEQPVAELGPRSLARAEFTTSYAGDIVGESTCWLQIAYVDGDPDDPHSLVGPYSGFELVRGTVDGRSGSFVLAATGDHRDGAARTEVRVVDGSGTGELAGVRGAGSYTAEAMEYTLKLDYDIDGSDIDGRG